MDQGICGLNFRTRLGLFFVLTAMKVTAESYAPSDTVNVTSHIIRAQRLGDVTTTNTLDEEKAQLKEHTTSLQTDQLVPGMGSVKREAAGKGPDTLVSSSTDSKAKAETISIPVSTKAGGKSTPTAPSTSTAASEPLPIPISAPISSTPVIFLSSSVSFPTSTISQKESQTTNPTSQTTNTTTHPSKDSTKNVFIFDKITTLKTTAVNPSPSTKVITSSAVTRSTTVTLTPERSADRTMTPTVLPTPSEAALTTLPKTAGHSTRTENESTTLAQKNLATISTTISTSMHNTKEPPVDTWTTELGLSATTKKVSSSSKVGSRRSEKLSSVETLRQSGVTRTSLGSTHTLLSYITTLRMTDAGETLLLSTSLPSALTHTVAMASPLTITSSKETRASSPKKPATAATTERLTDKTSNTPTVEITDETTEATTDNHTETIPKEAQPSSKTTAYTKISTKTSTSENILSSTTQWLSTTADCLEAIRVDSLTAEPAGQTTVTLTWHSLTSVSNVRGQFNVRVKSRNGDNECSEYTVQRKSDFQTSHNQDKQTRRLELCELKAGILTPVNGTVVIPDLKSCAGYDVTVTSECGSCPCNASERTATVSVSTPKTVPGPVRLVKVTLNETDSSRAQVFWEPPESPSCPVSMYLLQLFSTEGVCLIKFHLGDKDGGDFHKEDEFGEEGNGGQICKLDTESGSLKSPTVVFLELLPDTKYTLTVTAVNVIGPGLPVNISFHTLVAVPTSPTQLHVKEMTSYSMTLEWKPPLPRPGDTNYTVEVKDMGSPYFPRELLENTSRQCATGYESSSCQVDNLKAYWRYTLTLTASTAAGRSPPAILSNLTTEPSVPGPVGNLKVQRANDSFTAVKVTWCCPALAERNALITGFLVRALLQVNERSNHTAGVQQVSTVDCDVMHSVDVSVTPDNQYFFQVLTLAENANGTEWATIPYIAPPGPSQAVTNLSVTVVGSTNVTLQWSRPTVTNGRLTAYGVKVLKVLTTSSAMTMKDNEARFLCLAWSLIELEKNDFSAQSWSAENLTPLSDCQKQHDVIVARGNQSVTLTLDDLPPDSSLTLVVYPGNHAGWGQPENVSVHTEEAIPTAPTHISVNATNATTLVVSWTPPEPRPGATNYTVIVHRATKLDSSSQTFLQRTSVTVVGWSSHMAVVSDLWSGWWYCLDLVTSTSKGSRSVQSSSKILMPQSPPGKVQNMSVDAVANDYRHVQVTWDYPALRDRNGLIVNFNACCKWMESSKDQCQTVERPCQQTSPQFCAIFNVTPGENYKLMVRANNEYSGVPDATKFVAHIGPPTSDALGAPVTSSVEMGNSQSSFTVRFCAACLLNNTNGEITFLALLVCRDPHCHQVNKTTLYSQAYIESLPSWKAAKGSNFRTLYRPTDDAWIIRVTTIFAGGVRYAANSSDGEVYTVGEDEDCDSRDAGVFCNGPLPSGQSFRVATVSCTSASCAVSNYSASVLTAKAKAQNVITLTVVGCVLGLALGIVVVILVFCFLRQRRRQRPEGKQGFSQECEGEELSDMKHSYRAVTIHDFSDKLQEWKAVIHSDSGFPTAFVQQFTEIHDRSPQHSTTAATLEKNKPKNRYTNILPYDHTRVKLEPLNDDVTTDYINANYIPGYHSKREYIASQGPLESTVPDFWRLVWEQKCPVIVMLSALTEGRLNKVYQYYPADDKINQPVKYGMVTVTLQEVIPHEDYLVRTFRLSMGPAQHEVHQFFMDSWRDFQANLTPSLVLEFVRAVREHVPPANTHPLLIHCSAGVGRTGTWIAIDYFVHYIRHSSLSAPLNIQDFVLTMRDARSLMVQSMVQYIFIHEVVAELVRRKTEVDHYDEPVYSHQLAYANVSYTKDGVDTEGTASSSRESRSSSNNHRHQSTPRAPLTPATEEAESALPPPSPHSKGVMSTRL